MANEAVCIITPTKFSNVTIAAGVEASILKGTVMEIGSDPNTAIASAGNGTSFAGITWADNVSGATQIAVALDGEWDIKCIAGAGVTLGEMVCISGANLIRDAIESDFPNGAVLGKALETGSASEVIRVRLVGY